MLIERADLTVAVVVRNGRLKGQRGKGREMSDLAVNDSIVGRLQMVHNC